jgi:hypothetical protein
MKQVHLSQVFALALLDRDGCRSRYSIIILNSSALCLMLGRLSESCVQAVMETVGPG